MSSIHSPKVMSIQFSHLNIDTHNFSAPQTHAQKTEVALTERHVSLGINRCFIEWWRHYWKVVVTVHPFRITVGLFSHAFSAFRSERQSVSLRVLLELTARWHRVSAPSARTALSDPLLIRCWRSSAHRAGSWAAFSDDSLISHENRFAPSYTAELYAQHGSFRPNGTVAHWNATWKVTYAECLFFIWADSVNGRFFTAKDSSWG